MVPTHKIAELKNKYESFKSDPFYHERIKQLVFVEWARDVILETLKTPLTNETITGLIQILKNASRPDNVKSYLEKNIVDGARRLELLSRHREMAQTGFTGAGKAAVKKIAPEQLPLFQNFLNDAYKVKTVDEAVALIENFALHNIPEVKSGVYSPWLYYLNPQVFPIYNNSHADFINWCEQPANNYPIAIRLFHEVAETLGEKDLGLIDAFAHKFINSRGEKRPSNEPEINHPLNTILYGPPGTGKTYNTINKAVQIVNPLFFQEERTRDEVRAEYEKFKNEGQIDFITFHQSMSYEDFIEGIKPKKPEEGDEYLQYIIEEGLFKKIVNRADYKPTPQAAVFSLTDNEFTKASFYKISLGNTAIADDEQIYRYCIDNSYIALGWGNANDFTGKTEHEIQLMVPAELGKFEAQAVNYFIHSLKKDDYVVVSYGNLRFRAIGKVTGSYEYRNVDGLEVKQFRKVQWVLKDVDIPVEELYNRQFSQQTIYRLDRREIKREFFIKAQVSKKESKTIKNYVLIIDEINRGNIAQIFGELITLIEPDKRKGANEALEVILPYSKELFSVPFNLYILGTMNTADRSVETLDTALRRRFVFEEMMPKPELLSPKSMIVRMLNQPESWDNDWDDEPYRKKADALYELLGAKNEIENDLKEIQDENESWELDHLSDLDESIFTGVNLQVLLQTVNNRLSLLLTKDHAIGHAWLMDVYSLADLRAAFQNKILPLLKEYFYNNYAKIGLMLGDAFFEQQQQVAKNIFAHFKSGSDIAEDYTDKMVYTFKDTNTLTIADFISIYK